MDIKHCLLPNWNSIFAREILGELGRFLDEIYGNLSKFVIMKYFA